MERRQYKDIDDYISVFPDDIQALLQEIRRVIKESAPEAEEAIRYGMPTFRIRDRNLVHFAGFKRHFGFYPTPSGIDAYRDELSTYQVSKGAIQFPMGRPVPFDLIRKIVKSRVQEVLAKTKK